MPPLRFYAGLTLAASPTTRFFYHCNFIKTFLNGPRTRQHLEKGKRGLDSREVR